ncbi:MAG: nucleotidyl transferase AbiEii/AbiGii toxin family protein [Planctomycetes bacterium]|nr:nucleotidyl transferase AbiEii/AbiGii toxin family protein [Planctomycetota bacterium]
MRYRSAADFRHALEERLRSGRGTGDDALQRARKTVVFERLLVRLQADPEVACILKGGFALQLRLGGRARATRDLDLVLGGALAAAAEPSEVRIHEAILRAAGRDVGDFFFFEIGAGRELAVRAAPLWAWRYPVRASLAGRAFEFFHLDVAVGEPPALAPQLLKTSGLLSFADLPIVEVRTVSLEQHFAEKIHALTRPWSDRQNTRTRDLADLMLILDLGLPAPATVRQALGVVFGSRAEHPLPPNLPEPPESWAAVYEGMAQSLELRERTVAAAMARLHTYWKDLAWPSP